jgi:acyl carrier protein
MTTVPDPIAPGSAPSADALADALCELIVAEISLDPDEPVDATTDLLLTGLVDSLGVVRIVQWIEEELGLTVEPTDVVLENFQTVGAMVAYVERRRSEA